MQHPVLSKRGTLRDKLGFCQARGGQMSTRRKVAEAAGVSIRTVSNVVNDFTHVAPETRERVLNAINDLGYRPSELARSLKVGRSGMIGLMLPELDTPYFAELTRAFVDEGHARGFTVVVDQTNGDRDRESALVTRIARGGIFDALILSPLALGAAEITPLAGGAPVVMLGELEYPGFDKVMIDNKSAATLAVEHLLAQGATRIAAIGRVAREHRGTSDLRLAGWQSAHEAAGLSIDPALITQVGGFRRADGAAAVEHLIARNVPFDAIFAFSDPLAHGAMRALADHDIRVPDDVLVIGFDDNEEASFSIPTLSTISPDKYWLARTALDRVVARLDGQPFDATTFIAPYVLKLRASSSRG